MSPKVDRKNWRVLLWIGIGVFQLLNLCSFDLRRLLTKDFWIMAAISVSCLLIAGVVIVWLSICYMRFCTWFDRTLEREHIRIARRQAARQGEIYFPESDPMHDPEVDGQVVPLPEARTPMTRIVSPNPSHSA